LEYPLVFCPFLWDGHNSNNDKGLDSIIYHDTQHHAVIDYRKPWLSQDEWDDIKAKTKIEQAAEQLRLIYVALTRAIHRCVLIAGTYTTAHKAGFSSTQSTHSLLNWLVAGEGLDPHEWYKAQKSPVFIQEAWQRLQQRLQLDSPQALSLAPLALINGLPVQEQLGEQASLQALARPRSMPSAWRMSSYSGLMRGARQEHMAADHDTLWTQETEVSSMPSPSLDPRHSALDILHFPRGAAAGDCIHAVFERIDFTQAQTWSPAITQALQLFAPKNSAPQNAGDHEHMLLSMLEQVMQTELLPGLQLSQLAASKRLIELEFNLPVEQLFAHKLQELLSKWGYPVPILGFSDLQGYLHGFIDLVFEHQGRFYLLDWKSNHLGFDPQDYQQASIQAAMAQHGYHLQSLIYALSVHRYLKRRKRQYDHAQHFGGIFYLFVRGVRPDWPPQSGVYFHQPQLQVLDELSALLQPELN
jgi:exodeoxyribonuclease V beta subunit